MDLEFECPHCNGHFIIFSTELNCRIIRHGVLKETGEQMNPHLPKSECDQLFEQSLIWGCGKPVQIVGNTALACGYI